MIQFENVTATYADDAGIFDLSFLIEKGEMVFLWVLLVQENLQF